MMADKALSRAFYQAEKKMASDKTLFDWVEAPQINAGRFCLVVFFFAACNLFLNELYNIRF